MHCRHTYIPQKGIHSLFSRKTFSHVAFIVNPSTNYTNFPENFFEKETYQSGKHIQRLELKKKSFLLKQMKLLYILQNINSINSIESMSKQSEIIVFMNKRNFNISFSEFQNFQGSHQKWICINSNKIFPCEQSFKMLRRKENPCHELEQSIFNSMLCHILALHIQPPSTISEK